MAVESQALAKEPRARHSSLFAWMALAFTLFIIYGSLVPFDYEPVSQTQAARKFAEMLRQSIGPDTSSDWAANVLLFVPFAFFMAGCFGSGYGWQGLLKTALPIFALAFFLGFAVEYAQIYFAPRNPSLNDLLAQAIGTGMGLCAWRFWGRSLSLWLERDTSAQGGNLYRSLWFAYIAVLVIYSAFPLDLSMSLSEIYRKLRAGRIVLLPFTYAGKAGAELLYDLVTDVLIWIPPALLAWRAFSWPPAQIFLRLIAVAIGVEFMQIFVLTRVADITDVLLAGVGIFAGLRVGQRLAPRSSLSSLRIVPLFATAPWAPIAFALLWAIVVMIVFWYPYDFSLDRGLLMRRWQGMSKLPFVAYLASTEYRMLTEFLHKSIFFAPFGLALAWIGRRRKWLFALGCMGVFAFACAVEIGKMLLPGRSPDLGNLFVEMLGVFAAYIFMSRRMEQPGPSAAIQAPRWLIEVPVFCVCAALISLMLIWPGAPAAVRENLDAPVALAMLVLLFCAYTTVRIPLMVFSLKDGAQHWILVPLLLLTLSVFNAACLDLVFSTADLHAVAIWQAMLIWTIFGGTLLLALLARFSRSFRFAGGLWLWVAPFMLGALYWQLETVSVDISEALAANKAWAVFAFALGLLVMAGSTAHLSFRAACKGLHAVFAALLFWLLLVAGSFVLFREACAEILIRDGRLYSGLEYFLAPEGEHGASVLTLFLRYLMISALCSAIIALLQYPFWRGLLSVRPLQVDTGRSGRARSRHSRNI